MLWSNGPRVRYKSSMKLCECGCGKPTNPKKPKNRFLQGHSPRKYGPLCSNGCGLPNAGLGLCNRCYQAKWARDDRARHPERAKARDRAFRERHADQVRTSNRERQRRKFATREAKDARNAALRAKRYAGKVRRSVEAQQKAMAAQRARRAADPVAARSHKVRRRSPQSAVNKEWLGVILNDPCSYCGGPGGTIDHIDPVASGGNNEWTNLASSCRRCNARKSDKPLLLFLARTQQAARAIECKPESEV